MARGRTRRHRRAHARSHAAAGAAGRARNGLIVPRPPGPQLILLKDPAGLPGAAGAAILDAGRTAVPEHGRFTIALAGGATPASTYARLAQAPFVDVMPWERTYVFFGDERVVPSDHLESNFRMAYDRLLAKVPLAAHHVRR